MNSFITIAGVVLIGLMLLVLVRVIKGPTVIDRLVAVNVIGTKSIV
ncbi:MAG TPA: pH regulation protein F, partial [Verrucomicrobiales bacterium]|nr:pH regulation protein F [Verrucomicrobiales bacterium]